MTKNFGLDPAINEIGRARQAMEIPEQPQVVCTTTLWYQKIVMGHFKVGVYCIALPKALEHEYV